jgi:hypothetical protein
MRKASGNVSNGFYLRLYYKGYPTTERIFASYFNNGIPDYISIDNPSDYIIPKKIISLKEAREVIKNYLKENWSKELLWSTKGKKNKKYWGWHNVAEEFVFIDLDDHKNRPPLACYSRIDHTEPMFVHPNMNIGKYKVNYIKKGEKYIKDYSNLEKYNLSLEDFSNYGKHANFSRLAYIVTIDAPVISRDRDYAMFLVDAETGEIIGGY